MNIDRHIPNILTFGNLVCGSLGILNVVFGDLETASWLVFAAALFDLLDGLAARLIGVEGKLGQQLDSLSDMVSFGLLPGILLAILLFKTHTNWIQAVYLRNLNMPLAGLLAFLFPVGAAYRLAKFNLNAGSKDQEFRGLPCPAAGLLVASLPLIIEYDLYLMGYDTVYLTELVLNPWILIGIMLLLPLLMVSNIPMFNLKFDRFQWSGQQLKIIFVLISVICFIFLYFAAIPVIFVLYILFSLIFKNQWS